MRRVTVVLDDALYDRAVRCAAHAGLSVEEWIGGALAAHLLQDSGGAEAENDAPAAHAARATEDDVRAIMRFHRGAGAAGTTIRHRLARLGPALLDAAAEKPRVLEVLLFPYQPGEAGSEAGHPVAAEVADLAGSWDGLHYLLSPARRLGATWAEAGEDPFGLALYGLPYDAPMPDLGVGRPGYVPADAVLALAAGLAGLREADLRAVYDPAAMDDQQVYPLAWRRDQKEGFAYLLYYFEMLRDFYLRAAHAGEAVILCFW